jgi:hypothetical protein
MNATATAVTASANQAVRPDQIAARDVAELVRQDAGDLVRLPRPAQEALEEIDAPAGQRHGVRNA